MDSPIRQPLLLETLARRLLQWVRQDRIPLLSALIAGALAYPFAFTNKLVNHDEVSQLFAKGATVTSGRWGLGALDLIFPNISMPWIYGVITLVLMAAAICLILRLIPLKSPLLQGLLAGCIMVFPSLIGLFGYMFTSSSYALAFFLAVLAVFLLRRPGRLCKCFALGMLVASLSIYQSYISVAASLLVLVLIRQLLDGEPVDTCVKRGIGYVVFLIAGLGIYYVATQVVFRIKDVSFNAYASDSIRFSIGSVAQGISLAYQNFGKTFSQLQHRLIPTSFSRTLHYVLLAVMAVLLVLSLLHKEWKRILLVVVLIALLPLAINCMYVITSADSIHTLVLYSFVGVYILAALLADQVLGSLPGRLCGDLVSLALAGILTVNVYVANASYLNLHLRYENAYTFYTTLLADLKQMPEFTEGSRLAILGTWQEPVFYETELDFTHQLTGVTGFSPNLYSQPYFLEYYLGVSIPFASEEECAEIQKTQTFQDMPCYPYSGSTQAFGDLIVVKLSS